jgi:hypothetical protein
MDESEVSGLLTEAQYQEARKHLFPAALSLQWFIRNHRAGLVESGAILLLLNRRWIDPKRFDAYLVKAGRESAAQRLAEAA